MILHVALKHQRLNYWYTKKLFDYKAKKKITIEEFQKSDQSSIFEELEMKKRILNDTTYTYKKMQSHITKTEDGQFQCNFCHLKLEKEPVMICHVGMRPHNLAKDYSVLTDAHNIRNLWCKGPVLKY